MKKYGFTLAETLIVIVIIGVISAITIPSIILKQRNKELKSAFLKTWNAVDSAIKATEIETGVPLASSKYESSFLDIFYKQFGISTSTSKQLNRYGWGDTVTYSGDRHGPPVNKMYYTERGDMTLRASYAPWWCCSFCVTVDTNGKKGPNRWGYDLFQFSTHSGYKQGKGLRGHCSDYPWDITECSTGYGYPCGYWAIRDISPDDNTKKYWDNLK